MSASVGIGPTDAGGFALTVELDVSLPNLDGEAAEALVATAHEVCPYSNATRGNIPVTLRVVDPDGRAARPRRTAVPVTGADVGDVEGRTFRSSGQTAVCGVMMVVWPLVLFAMAISSASSPGAAVVLAVLGAIRRARLLPGRSACGSTSTPPASPSSASPSTRRIPWADVVGVVAELRGAPGAGARGEGPDPPQHQPQPALGHLRPAVLGRRRRRPPHRGGPPPPGGLILGPRRGPTRSPGPAVVRRVDGCPR